MSKTITSIIIGILIGVVGTGIFFGSTTINYRRAIEESRRDVELYRSRFEESEGRLRQIKDIIEGSADTLGGEITTISQARREIRSAIEAIQAIRKIAKD